MGANVLIADRYRLDEPLGRGGMGSVWRGVDTTLHRPVAVKLLTLEGDATLTERFHLEARAAARLNHPNLIAVYDFGDRDGRPYLVMELVEGRSLAEELTACGPLEAGRAADIAAQIARGLATAHQLSVVHRDIKPGNLMLATDGAVKIADFGIARLIDEASAALTAAGHVMGSSAYLAPERALGSPAGPASDVYSLGCVLYEMLTGQPPFRGDTAAAVAHQHVQADPTPPGLLRPGLPAPLTDLLPHLLAKTPESRPTAGQIADWLTNPTGHAEPATRPAPATTADPSFPTTTPLPPAEPRPGATAVLPVLPPPPHSPPGTPVGGRRSPAAKILIAALGALACTAALIIATTAGSGGQHQPPSPQPSSSAADPPSAQPSVSTGDPASTTAQPAAPAPHPPRNGHGKKGRGKDLSDQ
jgi:serine/threonine-protein kinase